MKKILFFALISTGLFSCNNDQPVSDSSIIPAGQPVTGNERSTVAPANVETIANMPQPAGTVQQQNTSAGSIQTSNAGINPAHGQPGHRCDIQVGAPLNSPVAKPTNVTQTTTTVPNTQINTVKTPPTAAGMNPAHGQPGHRCDISVGAPLNSPVTKPASNTTTPAATTISNPAPVAKTAPGMNPPHGQPGHRCDISVGAPLSSAPAKPAAETVKPATIQSEERANAKTIPVVPQ